MNIYIYGDSNTWGYVPNINGYSKSAVPQQYPKELIWWHCLTQEHNVIVNGLCGRAINSDNPWLKGRNAMKTIDEDLQKIGNNIDLFIIQLGTNDCKNIYNLSAIEIANQIEDFINKIREKVNSKIIIISPAQIKSGNKITDKYYIGAENKSAELDKEYFKISKKIDVEVISGLNAEIGEDGEHLTPNGHKYLSKKIIKKIKEIYDNKEK